MANNSWTLIILTFGLFQSHLLFLYLSCVLSLHNKSRKHYRCVNEDFLKLLFQTQME